jgi:hypothetical protein
MSGRRAAELAGWAVLAVVLSAWLAVTEVFWLPLRAGRVPVPLSVLAAVAGNLLLVGAARRRSRSRVVGVLPAVVWVVVVVAASMPRPEGDLVITGGGVAGGVNLAFLLLGVVAAAFAVGRVLAAPRGRTPGPPGGEDHPAAVR